MREIERIYRLPEGVSGEIDALEKKLEKFQKKELSPGEFKVARVTSGIYEQRTKGTYMLRMRLPGGNITSGQLRHITGIARARNAHIHLTDRQEMQMHNLDLSDIILVCRELLEAGLSPRGGGGNTVRNIMGCPRAGFCPNQVFDVTPFVIGTTEWMLAQKESYALPRKYKIAFSGCSMDCAMATVADMGFIAKRKKDEEKGGQAGFTVYTASGMGSKSMLGIQLEKFVKDEEALIIAEAIKRLFDQNGNRRDKHHARLRFLLEDLGEERFREIYAEEREALSQVKDIPRYKATLNTTKNGPDKQLEGEHADLAICPQKQDGSLSLEISIPFGNPSLDQLESLADILEESDGVRCRLSQKQNIILYNIPGEDLPSLTEKLPRLNLNIARRKGVEFVCCPGPSTCQLGICLSQGLQKQLEDDLSHLAEIQEIEKITICISGCPNACGHHPIASLGFFGIARDIDNRLAPHYSIVMGGKVQEGETRLAEMIGHLPARLIPPFTTEFLLRFAGKTEVACFDTYLESEGKDEARKLLKKYSEMRPPDDVYVDFGSKEEFTLKDRGAGECSAGVFDMIDEDLKLSEQNLAESRSQEDPARRDDFLHKALFHAARALLVTQGLEARDENEVFTLFKSAFIEKDYVSASFLPLIELGIARTWKPKIGDLAMEIARFREAIVDLYNSMDKSLRFQIRKAKEAAPEAEGAPRQVMDLQGVLCPLNYVKIKLELEKMKKGEFLDAILDAGRAIIEVPRSLKDDGHRIIKTEPYGENVKITIEKGG